MIRNSYHILDCNKNTDNFSIWSELSQEFDDQTRDTGIGIINEEIKKYHDNNKFEVIESNQSINNQTIINSKFIFKKGYYYCSYIYKYNNNYYITPPTYEYSKNPLCPKNEFTSIVISNTVPLNLNIAGVIYYYTYLSDRDQSQCRTNVFTFKDEVIVHKPNEKYIIDVVYFNLLLHNIKYSLTYIYYKGINYDTLITLRYKKTLKYNHLKYITNDNYNRLSTAIENTIYNETKNIILQLEKSEQNLGILSSLIDITKKNPDSLFEILYKIVDSTTTMNENTITATDTLKFRDCNINIFSDYLIDNELILNSIKVIQEDIISLFTFIKKLQNTYAILVESVYNLDDFSNVLKNENEFNNYKLIFDNIIEKKGSILQEDELTLYGLKPIINNIIARLNRNIDELNNKINSLNTNIDDNIIKNDNFITTLKEIVANYMTYEINMTDINETISDGNKLKIFMKLNNNKIKINKNKILSKYKKNTIIDENYEIENLNDVTIDTFNAETLNMYTNENSDTFNFTIISIFKVTQIHIENIYNRINNFYNYLDLPGSDLTYPTLYDIFYNIKNVEYKEYINNNVDFNTLANKFSVIDDTGTRTLIPNNYESIFKSLPKNDVTFRPIYNNRNNILKTKESNKIEEGSSTFLDVSNYLEYFINNLIYKTKHFTYVNEILSFNRVQITNCCKTFNVIKEYNRHINQIVASTQISVNTLTELKESKKFENLSIEQQEYIKVFLKINNYIFSIFNKHINHEYYNITNNFYSIAANNFSNFISLINTPSKIDEMEILNVFFSLKNCFEGNEKNESIIDDFIIIFYCFSISMFNEYPVDYFRFLFSLKNSSNEMFNTLFNEILHNKIYLYTENDTNYIKIVSTVSELILSEFALTSNVNKVNDMLKLIKDSLITELNKGNLKTIIDKLSVIQYFLSNDDVNIDSIKKYSERNKYNNINAFFRMINKYKNHNFNTNINQLIKLTNNYTINKVTTTDDSETNTKYCVSLEKNNKYECNVCDFSKQSLVKNLNDCPVNLPYNLDININNHLSESSDLAFEADTYRIFSYISEAKKELIYKRGRILYGVPNVENDIYEWRINKNYKNFTLLDKFDTNEDDPIIVKINNTDASETLPTVRNDLNIIYNNNNEFYLNNFYIKNIISNRNLKNINFKYPNSHQLYTKRVQNYYHIYFIENDIKYYMYLNILKNKGNYDIVWREDTYSDSQPFIKNYSKWRLIKTSEYVGNLFADPSVLYNIRSFAYYDNNNPNEIKGLVSNNNTCFTYNILLNNYLNKNFDLKNNTKFKLVGFNNNYNITPYIKYTKSVFTDMSQLQFLNYIKQQQIFNKQEQKKDATYDIAKYDDRIKTYIGSDLANPTLTLYLIKNPENDTYLYLDTTRSIVEFIPLFEDTQKDEELQFSKNDLIPKEFLWILQNSQINDKLVTDKIKTITNTYNDMVTDSINNLENNIKAKQATTQVKSVVNKLDKLLQTGGTKIKISNSNISSINNLIRGLQYIKYNDYILLLKQLDLIKNNSKQVLNSILSYNSVKNRASLSYNDYVTKSPQSIFVYFNKEENRFVCNLTDIINITKITFDLDRVSDKALTSTNIEIIIDNNTLDNGDNLKITNDPSNNKDNIEISISSTINKNISQIFIYINDYDFIINVKREDVVVYYNDNPIYNKLKKHIIKNTTVNKIFNIFNNLNIGKSNKNVYDFSVKLKAISDDVDSETEIYNMNKTIIIENLITYNNIIGQFHIKKNKLKDDEEYNSKIFYVSNDRNILYINLFIDTETISEAIYSVPCKYVNNIETKSNPDIYKYIIERIYTHILLLQTKNKSVDINDIFNFITILYKNNTYDTLPTVLNTNIDVRGFTFGSKKELNLYINLTTLREQFNTSKIPDTISIVLDKIINQQYINFDMTYSNFELLRDLYDKVLNIQFIKLVDLKNDSSIYEQYVNLVNSTKGYINYINTIKNNTDNLGMGNILNILNNNNSDFNIYALISKYFSDDVKDEFKLYLYNLFVSNVNINNYLLSLLLTVTQKVQNVYNTYSEQINLLLQNDTRFLDCIYRPGSIIDILYNFTKFFSDKNNVDDISFQEVKHGFYYKNSEDIYVNYVKINNDLNTISNNIYLVSLDNVIKNYSTMYPNLIQKKINENKLNKPYYEAYDTYINSIKYILGEFLNIKFNNIKFNRRIKKRSSPTSEQKSFYNYIKKNNTPILNYDHIDLNSNMTDKKIVKGDVIFYKFKRAVRSNNMFNITDLLLPSLSKNEWSIFNEFKNITTNSNNINKIVNKYTNIYSISNYNELFKSDLIDTYIIQENLLLKEVLPFNNDKNNKRTRNTCYFKLENNSIYLYLNDYKYKITLKKLIYSDLYLIIKNINNINYYLEFKFEEGLYNYNWVKENYNVLDNVMNKLLFINIESNDVPDTNKAPQEITENDMILIEYKDRFKNIFSHLNKFISNTEDVCSLNDTYITIHSRKYQKIIDNNNLASLLNLTLSKSGSSYILKDMYSKINDKTGKNRFYVSNYDCNSYIIYNSYKNIILDNSFTFIELGNLGLSLDDILNNLDTYKNYTMNLKYNKAKDLFYELNEYCSLTKDSNKFNIKNKSDNDKKAKNNTYYIYQVSKEGVRNNLFNKYISDYGITETVIEDDKNFHIIPTNRINKKIIQFNNTSGIEDTELSLIPINQHSEYYLISNTKNEYLRVNNLIDYKKPLRVSLEFVSTRNINMDYLWYIKNNIENVSEINIKSDSSTCMVGGQQPMLNTNLKEKYLTKVNTDYLESAGAQYNDLCDNNTNVNFINYNMIETQDDVSYIDCRNECGNSVECKGFSYSKLGSVNKCYLYNNEGTTDNGVPIKDISMVYYDCNKSLTEQKQVGEIKTNESYNTIDLIDNNLYYIKCKNTNEYIEFNKDNSVYDGLNYLKCNTLSSNQNLYSNNIFKFKVEKNNFNNGNIKFFSLLTQNKHILGTYKNSSDSVINIKYENDKYVWEHVDSTKWHIEPTNNIYEYTVVEGDISKTFDTNGEVTSASCNGTYCCPFYYQGYKTVKINADSTNKIVSVIGPGEEVFTKMYNDENISIFKNIKDLDVSFSTNYEGNIFIVKNTSETDNLDYYNIFSIFNNEKYHIYKSSDNLVKFNKIDNMDNLNSDAYLWNFEIYNNNKNSGFSYQKITVGGDERNPEQSTTDTQTEYKVSEQVGGVKLNELQDNNVYYIKSSNDNYLCANNHYIMSNGTKTQCMTISINSRLAVDPSKVRKYNNKFVRASIDLSDTKYNINKQHSIDDDILWKLEKVESETNVYKFYNIKHKIYLKINDTELEIRITESPDSQYFNLYRNNAVDKNTLLSVATTDPDTLVSNIDLINFDNDKQIFWTFDRPSSSTLKNPYMTDSEFNKLENGKIYRIVNQGVKDNTNINTYLAVNELKNELLIPYDESLINSQLDSDPTLWKCIINDDNTYSFICMYNNYKLGNLENRYSLLKNVNNKLHFKNSDISISDTYLTDKFYIQHSNDEYYNIINSKNLNYYICGFSNNDNTYDDYELSNIKYTHKVANNSNWLLTCKLEEQQGSDLNIFSDEPNYYLYATSSNELKYSVSYKYNEIYNTIYYENNVLNTNNNIINKVIKKGENAFKKYNGFTLSTNTRYNPKNNNEPTEYYKDNLSIILTTNIVFYTIRFINFKDNELLIRITCNDITTGSENEQIIEKIQLHNKNFNKLDFKETRGGKNVSLSICAPDIYTDENLFNEEISKINITYDKEFLNVFINNKLITYTRIINTLFNNIYFTSNKENEWTNILWYKHTVLLNTPLWTTENVDNFKNNKPGIKFTSKTNNNATFTAIIEQKTQGYFYIRNEDNYYLSINNKTDNIYNVEFISTLPTDESSCLWKLYDTNVNKKYKLKISSNERNELNEFILDKDDIKNATYLPDEYINNIYNSTNIMIKARLNKETNVIDNTSNYEYSIIDLNSSNDVKMKKCSWLHNKNGHINIDYNPYLSGSHFTTDIWNLQYIMGVNPTKNNKFLVKYRKNKGIVEIGDFIRENYGEFGTDIGRTLKMRWNNFENIKGFDNIKSQNNIYIDSIKNPGNTFDNTCITLNTDPVNPGAYCEQVKSISDCNDPNSVLFMPNEKCKNVLYKNYKLLKGEPITGGSKIIKGGNIWIEPKYFYLNNKTKDKTLIFNNIHNVTYEPSFDITDESLLTEWIYTDNDSRNIIYNKIYNNFDYDGYIEDVTKKLIRAVILPNNFVLFTNDTEISNDLTYVSGRMKSYSIEYKDIKVIKIEEYFTQYSNFYINIQTKKDSREVESTNLTSENYKLNKCYKLINDNICISVENNNKTSIAKNIANNEFLFKNFDEFKDSNNNFRIVNMYGKYLCDLYINNTKLCNRISDINEIVMQGQYDFVNLEKEQIHTMHSTSSESLWHMVYNETNDTYKIINSYTNKSLNESKELIIEYVDNKYFKQQFINSTQSKLMYNFEDVFYIYYLDESLKRQYLSYQDVLINNTYTKTSLIQYSEIPQLFIIKKANYNLDILTDEIRELPSRIKNVCYNKTNTCNELENIPLISNIKNNCLNITYELREINPLATSDEPTRLVNVNKLYSKLLKNHDNFLVTNTSGIFELVFKIHDINVEGIIYAFTTLHMKTGDLQLKIQARSDDNDFMTVKDYTDIPYSSKLLEYNDILPNNIKNADNIELKLIMKSNDKRIKLNYVEFFGTPKNNVYRREMLVNNTEFNDYEPIKINRSYISKKNNIDNNLVKIKYINKNQDDSVNTNLNSNIVSLNNNLYSDIYDIPKISNIDTEDVTFKFILVFKPLLNCYMFYIENNKYLTINNSNEREYINGYYFKLVESDTIPMSFEYKLFNIQCYDNSNLFINVNGNNELELGTVKHDFIFINVILDNKTNLINYNNLINNNILYDFYIKCVYITPSDNIDVYYYVVNSNLKSDNKDKTKLLLKMENINNWSLTNVSNNSSVNITDLENINDNTYTFKDINTGFDHTVIIKLNNNYDDLKINTNKSHKKYLSLNDINKTLDTTSEFSEPLLRNKKYLSYNLILNEIILSNIVSLQYENLYLIVDSDSKLVESETLNKQGYFVEIMLDIDNLCKLWSNEYQKFIKYDTLNNIFILDNDPSPYNDIDLYNDIDVFHTFEKIENANNTYTYKLYYASEDTYLNVNSVNTNKIYQINKVTDISEFDVENYDDYCNKICFNNSNLENKLMNNKNYNIKRENTELLMTLSEYTIKMSNPHSINNKYFEISTTIIHQTLNVSIENFKEKSILKSIFDTGTRNLNISIVTVDISTTRTKNLCNIILFNNSIKTYGRFENDYDRPEDESLYLDKNFNIVYDSNYNKIDFSDNKSYVFSSYINKPSKKYVQINDFNIDIIKDFNISLFHYDNTMEDSVDKSQNETNKLANIRKLYTTCSWGDCPDYDTISEKDISNISENLRRFETLNKLSGGMLDLNMVKFLRKVNDDDINSFDKNIDFYKNSPSTRLKYVYNNSTYFESNTLRDILFKKNDIIEIHKIYGKIGWTNSHNSLYNKSLFEITNTNIRDIDYYDTFRNIYPISFLEEKYAFNSENLWKPNNWFEDSPHFRSLPFWKFEEVQVGKTSTSNTIDSLQFTGGNNNNKTQYNQIVKKINNSSLLMKTMYLLALIITIYSLYELYKSYTSTT
mgnify:CR=1 FL=1